MNEVIKNIKERRSIRRYIDRQVEEEILNEILEAGITAPNAGGRQSAIVVVSQDAELNEELGKINCSSFYANIKKGTKLGVSKDQPSIADDRNIKSAFYKAPTVITIFAPDDFLYAAADSAVIAQNIMLAAHSVGLGTCLIGRADKSFESELGREVLKMWEIQEGYQATFHITLGYYDCEYPKAKPRKENRIVRV